MVATCPKKLFSATLLDELHQFLIIICYFIPVVVNVESFCLESPLVEVGRQRIHQLVRIGQVLLLRALGVVEEHPNAFLVVIETVHYRYAIIL